MSVIRWFATVTHADDCWDATPPVSGSNTTDTEWAQWINKARGLTLRVGDGGPE